MPIFVFHFKVKPIPGHHLTVKHGYAAVYVRANDLTEADAKAREHVAFKQWTVSEVAEAAFAYNPALHDLPEEAARLCRHAESNGVAIGVAAVGFAPDGSGPKS